MSVTNPTVDNLVIGGGLAGSMVAIRLAGAGQQVTLLEKEMYAHHKVCGEFLSPEAIEYLRQVGIGPSDLTGLGAATIRCMRLSSKRQLVETTLPFTARSLSRFALDAALLARAERSGCNVRRGAFVDQLTSLDNMWLVRLRNGETLRAQTVFLANGKYDLRGWGRMHSGQDDLIAFKLHLQLAHTQTEELRNFIEIFLFSGGYGGLSLIEKDLANLCLVVQRSEFRRIGGWPTLLASILHDNRHMQRRLQAARALWDRPLAIAPIPYGYLGGRQFGLWCVGDQAAVIPSFTGDGMSIALHSAALATEMYLDGESAGQYYRRLHAQLSPGMLLARALSRSMVSSAGRKLAPIGLSLFPAALRWIAASTRIPERALLADPALYQKAPANAE